MWVDSVGLLDFKSSRSLLGLMASLLSFPSEPVVERLQSRLDALAKILGTEAKEAQRRDRHEIRSELDELCDARSVARRIAADTHELPACPDSRHDLAHDLPHRGRAGIPHALPEVARCDVQPADPAQRQSGV